MPSRRAVLGSLVAGGALLAGCTTSDGASDEADVVAGPDTNLTFEPDTLRIEPGEAVTWYFASPGHNVSGVPSHHDEVTIPDGADPFASYEGDNRYRTVERGDTYTHTFETPGTYHYVCIPHAPPMTGTIHVDGDG